MRKLETLTCENALGESITFSHADVFCPQEITGLADVCNNIYSINSMGQDGNTFVANRIEARDIDIVGFILKRDPEKMRQARRALARVLNPQFAATLTYRFGNFVRKIGCRSVNAPTVTKPEQNVYAAFVLLAAFMSQPLLPARSGICAHRRWSGSL